MKHLLNNLSNEEKNTIREQHKGGLSVDNSKFRKLLESTLGNVKPLLTERSDQTSQKTSLPNNVMDTGLKIDCTRRVITSTNIHLTKEMNSIVIGAFCDMKNRNTEKMKSDAPPPSPATNESKFGSSKPLIMEQLSGETIVNNVATEGIKNVTSEMISSPPFDGDYSGYQFGGVFNNIEYAWNCMSVEGMSGVRGIVSGQIMTETIENMLSAIGQTADDAKSQSPCVGFYSSNIKFIIYTTSSNKPKCMYF